MEPLLDCLIQAKCKLILDDALRRWLGGGMKISYFLMLPIMLMLGSCTYSNGEFKNVGWGILNLGYSYGNTEDGIPARRGGKSIDWRELPN